MLVYRLLLFPLVCHFYYCQIAFVQQWLSNHSLGLKKVGIYHYSLKFNCSQTIRKQLHAIFYKQHFYKQHQVEIGKN